jgi:hypothetical protein
MPLLLSCRNLPRMQTRTTKTCKVCGDEFNAWSNAQRLNRFCGPVCAAKWGAYQRDRKRDASNRKELAKRKEALKTLGETLLKAAQAAVNLYIRRARRRQGLHSPWSRLRTQCSGMASGMDCGHLQVKWCGTSSFCAYASTLRNSA